MKTVSMRNAAVLGSIVLAACGIGPADVGPTSEVPAAPAHSETHVTRTSLPAGVVLLDLTLPDASGKLHSGVAVVSSPVAPHLAEYTDGFEVFVDPNAAPIAPFDTRVDEQVTLIGNVAAVNADAVAIALVFREDQVTGWHGQMRPDSIARQLPLPAGQFEVRTAKLDALQTTTNGQTVNTSIYSCSSAYAFGTQTAGSTAIADMKFYTGVYPFGSQIFTTQQVGPSWKTYSWGTNAFSTTYYVTMTQGVSGVSQVNSTICCSPPPGGC